MNPSKSLLRYELKLVFSHGGWLALLVFPGFVLLTWAMTWQSDLQMKNFISAASAFEILLPAVAALTAAPLMSLEGQSNFNELRASYPEPWWQLPLTRTLDAFLWKLLAVGVGVGALTAAGLRLDIQTLLPAMAPSLWLLGLGLLVGNLTQNYWATIGVSLGYWLINLIAQAELRQGTVTGALFPFAYSFPLEQVSYELNRALLAGLGTLCLVLNAWLAFNLRRRKWKRHATTS